MTHQNLLLGKCWKLLWATLKCLWTENYLCLVLEFSIKNTCFQSLRSLGLKLMILQAFKVVLFYPKKWSGEWIEFNPKWPKSWRYFVAMSLFALSEFLVGKWDNMEENMSNDSESSFVGLVYQQRNTVLAASFLSCPPYCEKGCGNKVTSEVDIMWYFGCSIQIPFLRVKSHKFEGL